VRLSYALLGFEQSLIESDSFEAFQAGLATARFRRRFGRRLLVLCATLLGMSLVALVLRWRRRITTPWPVPIIVALAAAVLGILTLRALFAISGMCC
jgi:hypothetical protein